MIIASIAETLVYLPFELPLTLNRKGFENMSNFSSFIYIIFIIKLLVIFIIKICYIIETYYN